MSADETYWHDRTVGAWRPGDDPAAFDGDALTGAIADFRATTYVIRDPDTGRLGVARGGSFGDGDGDGTYPVLAVLPALYPEWLGERAFIEAHGLRFPYVAGEMANGIATPRMVIEMANVGMLGFFGAAGLAPTRVADALDEIAAALGGDRAWGANLIHSPDDPKLEREIAGLYLARGVTRVSASAFMTLSANVVRFAASGLTRREDGTIRRRNHVFAKVSRPEVAAHFLGSPPEAMLHELVAAGHLTAEEADLAGRLPVAGDITVEADSGGHTDNRPLTALLPTIRRLGDTLAEKHGFPGPVRVGAAGGLGTPAAVAAAFALGAAYVMTGSINQSAIESGQSDPVRRMLAGCGIADVMMAPAGDMFEMGVKVQVLKKGTMFGPRAQRLYELYRAHDSLEAIPAAVLADVEKKILGRPVADVWEETRAYFAARDPVQIDKAEADARHKMALVFRWYLGQSSRWSIAGDGARVLDYQVWCGPAMGAFNDWAAGSFLAEPENRSVTQIALNLLEGAAHLTRAQQVRSFGLPVPPAAFDYRPRPLRPD